MKANRIFITGGRCPQVLFAFCFALMALSGFAQQASPYSRYGLGYVRSNTFSANYAMGGLSAAYASMGHINVVNPASYASLVRTTIEAGFTVNNSNIQTKDSVYKTSDGNISHIAVAFVPKPDKFAITMGLLPYTNINYDFIQDFKDPQIGAYRYAYSGKGSLYQVFLGGAYKIKGRINDKDQFSIGANIGYVFGKLSYQKIITFPDTAYSYSSRNVTAMNANSFTYNAGFQYRRLIYHNSDAGDARNDIYMTLGVNASGGIKMNAKVSNYWERFRLDASSGYLVTVDTAEASFDQKSKINMPVNVGAGVMFGNERFWMLGADFKYSTWSQYSSVLNNGQLKDSWRIAVGAQIIPKYDANRNYFAKVQYRLGGYYGKSMFTYNSSQLTEAGGTVGLGFPFKIVKFASASLNLGGDFGSRSASDKSAVRETYYNISVGFVLNDLAWFIKRKFD